jgi:ankyrin repeat protein
MTDIRQVDKDFAAALFAADFETAGRLLAQGIDINNVSTTMRPDERGFVEDTTTYLLEAATRGNVETVRFLLKNGANPNIAGKFADDTPLLCAASRGYVEVVDLLLEHGADFSAVDHPSKFTAMEYAIYIENAAIVRSLFAAGAPPTFRRYTFNRGGGAEAREIIRMLIDHGVDINKRDDWGRTQLMWAAEGAELETVRFLIDSGADVNIVSGENMNGVSSRLTALQLARRAKRDDVVALLLSRGAHETTSLLTRFKKSMGW